jgi:diadenylate cyclase
VPIFANIRWLDVLDVIIVAFLIYQLYKLVKGTVAIRIFAGILVIYIFWKVVEALKMELLTEILGQFIGVGVIALIIVFQQELRRFLIIIGTTGMRSKAARRLFRMKAQENNTDIDSITTACYKMGKSKTGALLVLTQNSSVDLYSSSGDSIDAKLSSRLLEAIFYKNNPLHDGAVIIKNNRITAARCVLPVSESKDFPAHYGMRHRAAVGITENSDAMAIVVSEQTGAVSLCKAGEIQSNLNEDAMKKALTEGFNN